MNKALPVSTQPIRICLPSKPLFARPYILFRTRSLFLSIDNDTLRAFSPLKKLFARPDIDLGPASNMQAVSVITHSVESCSSSKASFARPYFGLEFSFGCASSFCQYSVELSSPCMTLPVRPCVYLLFLSSFTQPLSSYLSRYYWLGLIFS